VFSFFDGEDGVGEPDSQIFEWGSSSELREAYLTVKELILPEGNELVGEYKVKLIESAYGVEAIVDYTIRIQEG
jgi:hypothetical protein